MRSKFPKVFLKWICKKLTTSIIDLFTDMAAILNQFNLNKEYYGTPKGHKQNTLYMYLLSVRNMIFHCIFLRKKATIITS